MHATDELLVRRALGEALPDVDRHVADCARCAEELAELDATIAAARAEAGTTLPPAPPAVWERVREELGLGDAAGVAPVRPRAARWALAGAAALAGGVLLGSLLTPGTEPAPDLPAQVLSPVAGAEQVAPAASGTVRLAGDARALVVDADGLPAPTGYYEVWLLDPESGRMVALGALRDDGSAELPLPAGVSVTDYPSVDVSVERDDGDPRHSGVSALRGPVPA